MEAAGVVINDWGLSIQLLRAWGEKSHLCKVGEAV